MPTIAANIRRRFKYSGIVGAVPGTLQKRHKTQSRIHALAYGPDEVIEANPQTAQEAYDLTNGHEVIWINVFGLSNTELLEEFGTVFGIHHLSLEDVLNVNHRAKYEKFDNYEYYVTRMASYDGTIESEQISTFHTGKYVICFQQHEGDCLDSLRERIQNNLGTIRTRSSDFLVYAIIDTVIDNYYPIVDALGEQIDQMDSNLLDTNIKVSAVDIHRLRSQFLDLGRWLKPNREMLNRLLRDEVTNMTKDTQLFMRDCYDHVVQLNEQIETYREICSDLRAYHLSVVGNRTNDVMKTLTIVTSIFIPLGFLAGLYGMNFDHIPELHYKYGYYVLLITMVTLAASLLAWFKLRGWFDE